MNFIETSVADALLIEPVAIRDDRGHFARIWCSEEFAREGNGPAIRPERNDAAFAHP